MPAYDHFCTKCNTRITEPRKRLCVSCRELSMPSRTPKARSAQYQASRTTRQCKVCREDLPLESRSQKCAKCAATPNPRCSKCRKVKPLTQFSRDATRVTGYFPWCMGCQAGSTSQFQNPDDAPNGHICPLCDTPCRGHANRRFCSTKCKDRVSALKNSYGLSVADYRRLVEDNKGKCPICGCVPTQWNIDHNHQTLLTTGAVCQPCNIGLLAYSNHDVEKTRNLLWYLENTPAERLGIEAKAPDIPRQSNLHKKWSYGGRFKGKRA